MVSTGVFDGLAAIILLVVALLGETYDMSVAHLLILPSIA